MIGRWVELVSKSTKVCQIGRDEEECNVKLEGRDMGGRRQGAGERGKK